MGFTSVMDQIISTITSDVELNAYATTNLGRAFTSANVKKVFKARPDILVGELPLIMITRPGTSGDADSDRAGTYTHTVRVYCGFLANDRYKAQDILINLEELIENAMMLDSTLGGLVDFVSPSGSENDEGYNHPQYWIVKEFKILKETTWT